MSSWGVGPIRMDHAGVTALNLSGTDWVSTPDSAANSVAGDLDLRMKVSLADWSVASQVFASKWNGGDDSWIWAWIGGTPAFYKSTTGSNEDGQAFASMSFVDGSTQWIRLTSVASTGLTRFYTGTDSTTWTQQGPDRSFLTGSFFDATAPVRLGAFFVSTAITWPIADGNIHYFEMRDGINGSVVQSFDANAVDPLGTRDPSTVAAGGPWTVNGAGWDWVEV